MSSTFDWNNWLAVNYELALRYAARTIKKRRLTNLSPGDLVHDAASKILKDLPAPSLVRPPPPSVDGPSEPPEAPPPGRPPAPAETPDRILFNAIYNIARNHQRRPPEALGAKGDMGTPSDREAIRSPWSGRVTRGSVDLDELHLNALRADVNVAKTQELLKRRAVDLGAFILLYVRGTAARFFEDWSAGEGQFTWNSSDEHRACHKTWLPNAQVWTNLTFGPVPQSEGALASAFGEASGSPEKSIRMHEWKHESAKHLETLCQIDCSTLIDVLRGNIRIPRPEASLSCPASDVAKVKAIRGKEGRA